MKLRYFMEGLSQYEKALIRKVFKACEKGSYVNIPVTKKFKLRFVIDACLTKTTEKMVCASDWDVLSISEDIASTIMDMVVTPHMFLISPKISEVFVTFESGVTCSILMEQAIVVKK